MKSFIFAILILISGLCSAQVTIDNGYLDSQDNFIEENSSTIYKDFKWSQITIDDEDVLVCGISSDSEDSVTVLSWKIEKTVVDNESRSYHVKSDKDKDYIITFMRKSNIVFILNIDTAGFSAMYGKTLNYTNLN